MTGPLETAPHPGRDTILDERVDPRTGDGDHDRFAHVCHRDDVARAYVTGEAITALCGKRWVPSRNPDKYPVCQACMERLAQGMKPDRSL
ncbi:MAG TPA: DUF3039 domain-containing protein [Acidimicrobiales bacterium]|jgi:hypothetical protein